MARLLFIDPVCSSPYQDRTLFDRALGGPEASTIRVAEGLAQRGHRVTVAQTGRAWPTRSPSGVAYVPFDYDGRWDHLPRAEAVVVLRQHKILPRVRKRFRDARMALWLHVVPGRRGRALGAVAAAAGATIVCVSDAHRAMIGAALDAAGHRARTARIHNPVDDGLTPDGSPVDPDKLVFASSPHKGLDEVLEAYRRVKGIRPRARLYLADPGYWRGARPALPAGAIPLGPLPHREVVRHVREAFAVFYPQAAFEETFGLVFAEANAVGTPVVAHPHRAACEVLGESLDDACQLVDAADPDAAADRLAQWWAEGRPAVACPPHFRISRVVADWERLLGVVSRQPHVLRTVGREVATAA